MARSSRSSQQRNRQVIQGIILDVVLKTMGDLTNHMEVLKLLQSQNRSLRKMYTHSQDFLASSWSGDLNQLRLYEAKRAVIMRAMALYDNKIEEVIATLLPHERTPELIQNVRSCLNEKSSLCQSILELDCAIMKMIHREQQKLSQLVSDSEKSRELMNRFKSTWMPESGESLDGRI